MLATFTTLEKLKTTRLHGPDRIHYQSDKGSCSGHISQVSRVHKTQWVSKSTLTPIADQQKARNMNYHLKADYLNKRIARSARKDKKKWLEDRFEQATKGGPKEQWEPVRST